MKVIRLKNKDGLPGVGLAEVRIVAENLKDEAELVRILRYWFVFHAPKGVTLGGVEIIRKKKKGEQSK